MSTDEYVNIFVGIFDFDFNMPLKIMSKDRQKLLAYCCRMRYIKYRKGAAAYKTVSRPAWL